MSILMYLVPNKLGPSCGNLIPNIKKNTITVDIYTHCCGIYFIIPSIIIPTMLLFCYPGWEIIQTLARVIRTNTRDCRVCWTQPNTFLTYYTLHTFLKYQLYITHFTYITCIKHITHNIHFTYITHITDIKHFTYIKYITHITHFSLEWFSSYPLCSEKYLSFCCTLK